jgi:hypothetical protein
MTVFWSTVIFDTALGLVIFGRAIYSSAYDILVFRGNKLLHRGAIYVLTGGIVLLGLLAFKAEALSSPSYLGFWVWVFLNVLGICWLGAFSLSIVRLLWWNAIVDVKNVQQCWRRACRIWRQTTQTGNK